MKLKVLVVGAGMYVCGRGTNSYGTVLPSLYEAYRNGLVDQIYVASRSKKSINVLMSKAQKLSHLMGFKPPIEGFPKQGINDQEYLKVVKKYKPDCAILVVPDHDHCRMACNLLANKIPVLVVKPLAPTLVEAKRMIKSADQSKVYAAVEFHKRYDEANLKLKDVIVNGELGDILSVWVGYSQRKLVPEKIFKSWAAQTNIFQYLGVHYVDIIYFVTGAKPLRVLATGQKYWLKQKGIDTYDAIQVMTEWQNPKTKKKFVSTILTHWVDPNKTTAMSDQKISVVGTKGRYDSDQKNRGVQIVTDENGIEDFNPYFSQFYGSGANNVKFLGYGERSIRQFLMDVESLRLGRTSLSKLQGQRPTFKEALVSTAVVEAAAQSLKNNNQWVTPKERRSDEKQEAPDFSRGSVTIKNI